VALASLSGCVEIFDVGELNQHGRGVCLSELRKLPHDHCITLRKIPAFAIPARLTAVVAVAFSD
jgi:hypothetical protein